MANPLRIPFPLKGKDANWAVSGQPPLTSPDLQNVRPRDVQDKRSRGGQRPGVRKVMYWWDYPGGGADLGLPYPSPIIGMAQVTAVYYASVAGEAGASYTDPTGGDPKWDAALLFSGLDSGNSVQAYSFTGNQVWGASLGNGSGDFGNGLAIDKVGNIYAYHHTGTMTKYDKEGNALVNKATGAVVGKIWPSTKDDDIVFWAGNDTLYILNATTLVATGVSRDFNKVIYDIAQLSGSNDILVPLDASASNHVQRINRVDFSVETLITIAGASGARSIAVDETNEWIYIVDGTKVFRGDLADGGNVESYEIPGGDLMFVRLYGDEVFVCGGRATDNNTVWKLDAALAGIEASYDTGSQATQMRILSNGTVYVAGDYGTNEDAVAGNVNVLSSALVRSDTWNVQSGKNMTNIAEKWE